MPSLVFTSKAPRTSLTQDGPGFWRWLAIVDLVLIVSWISVMSMILARGNVAMKNLTGQFLMFLVMLLALPTALSQWQRTRLSRNCELTLNQGDLSYACRANRFNWSWQDLSPFEVRAAKPFRSWSGVSHVRIGLRSEGAIRRFMRSWREPRMILDAYGTPLEEIAATMNEYRDKALRASVPG